MKSKKPKSSMRNSQGDPHKTYEDCLENSLMHIRLDKTLPEPTIFYKKGDRVLHGNIDESHVTDVLDGGKILQLNETCTENNWGKPYKYKRDIHVQWYEVVPYRKWEADQKILKDRRHPLSYSQRDINGVICLHYGFGVDYDTNYQRGRVWTMEDKLALIDSIFNVVDIGKMVFFHRESYGGDKPLYEIIDGKQRLSTLIEFFEGKFKWRGLTYHELHPSDRSHFEGFPVSYAELRNVSKAEILDCFIRLNTSGRPQDPKHLEEVRKLFEAEAIKSK